MALQTTTITTPSGQNIGRNILNTLEERLLDNVEIKNIFTVRNRDNKTNETTIRYSL